MTLPSPRPKGWKPAPADWVDWVVVDRIVAGRHPGPRRPTHAEYVAAARIITRHGGGASLIAKVLRRNGSQARQLAAALS